MQLNNLKGNLLTLFLCLIGISCNAQNPVYGNEKEVTINGLTFDAMEPHLSTDGNALFFNSLNNGTNTALYYAARVNDTIFNYIGAVPIVNQTLTPYLNAVASLDSSDNFYWVSTRDWPTVTENLHRIRFLTSSYTNYGRVYGDFYINSPGWLIMDAAISYQGQHLLYCNAWFNNCAGGAPCKASMGIAQKINDSTFNKLPNTAALFANINADTVTHIVYAPFLTMDGLELFYSRLLHNGTQTEVMVATRSNTNAAFGMPSVLVSAPSLLPEAPALTADKSKLYYHKKVGGIFKLFMLQRAINTQLTETVIPTKFKIYPNPASTKIYVDSKEDISIQLYSLQGHLLLSKQAKELDISELANGMYILHLYKGEYHQSLKIIKD